MPWTPVLAGRALDAAVPEELASGLVERVVVPVDVAQVDPGADDVAEPHAALVEQALRRAEHVPGLLERIAPGAVDVRRVERDLVAEADEPRAGPARSPRTGTGSRGDVAHRPGVAMAGDHATRESSSRALVERRLLDERGAGAPALWPRPASTRVRTSRGGRAGRRAGRGSR